MRFKSINRQEIAGFTGPVPELRYMPSGDAVLELSVATTHSWKDKNDKWHDETEWHPCIFYRKMAEEVAAQIKTKGMPIYIVGRTNTREWEAQDKSKRKRREVIVEHYHLIQYEKGSDKDAKEATDNVTGDTGDIKDGNMAGFDN